MLYDWYLYFGVYILTVLTRLLTRAEVLTVLLCLTDALVVFLSSLEAVISSLLFNEVAVLICHTYILC